MMNNNSFLSGSDDWRCITPPKSRRSPNGCPNNPDLWKYDPLSSSRSSGSSLQSGSSGSTPSPDLSLDFDRVNSPGLLNQSTLSSGREIRCRNCTELMCLDCLRFQNNEVSPQIDGWTNSADRFSTFPTFSPDRDCWNMKCSHIESLWYYCQTCSMPFCSTCNTRTHFNHEYSSLKEAWEDARQKSRQTVTEATYHLNLLQNEEERGLLATIQLDQRAREAASLVTSAFARIIAAAESRKMELLGRIQELRRQKYLDLKARSDMVTKMIKDLKDCIDLIVTSLDTALIFNPTDLYIIKDTANPHIFRSRMFQNIQPRVDESWISFHGPDHRSISQMLQNHGSIQTSNPRSSGRRQMPIREERSEQELSANLTEYRSPLMTVCDNSQSRTLTPRPRGRPIPLSSHRVVSRFNRNEAVTVFGNVCNDSRDNLCRPWGVTCDRDGKILVADRSNNRILIFFQDGTLARCFGSHGAALGQFDRPAGIAVDSRKRIIVADKDNHRIQVLNYEGRCIFAFGEKGSGDGQFNYPWDVSVNTECEIVVSDTRNHRVQLFSPEGVFLRKFGFENQPNLWKTFDSPRGVAFTPEGKVLVTDFNNHRIFSIDYDFMNGHAFACTDNNGNTNNKLFLRPQGLVVDDDGNIIVADSRNHRIQAFNSSGRILWKFGTHGSGPREMDRPSGIALNPDGKVIVVDFGNNRVLLI